MGEPRYDVIIAGGGPAGSTTAAFLARNGHRVLLLEKERFPRFHIGEGLLPALWDVWDAMGITSQVEAAGFTVKQGVNFALFGASRDLAFLAGEFPKYFPRPTTFHVERARYDQILLDHARRSGVDIRSGWTVHDLLFEGERAVGVRAAPDEGSPCSILAPVVVDATGRRCLVAQKMGWRKPDPALNKLAYFSHFRGAQRSLQDGSVMTDIHTLEGGWLWYIPLANDIVSVGAVLDAEYVRRGGLRGAQARFDAAVRFSPRVSSWLASASQVMPMQTISNISYQNDHFVGDGFVLVGDAAVFVDPIFSAGVTLAMRSGQFAADAIHEALSSGDTSAGMLDGYERRIKRPMHRLFKMIYHWYQILERQDADNIFVRSLRMPLLRERLVVLFSGGYDRDDLDAISRDADFV